MLHTMLGRYSVEDEEPLKYVKQENGEAIFAIKVDDSVS